jgi:prepilin-type N-terminal cleavage/methylation domain-containing protein
LLYKREELIMKKFGFSMVELLVTLAIMSILAVISINYFTRQKRTAMTSEVPAMFAEIKRVQISFQGENGYFLKTSSSETNIYPALGTDEPVKKEWNPAIGSAWEILGASPPDTWLYCGYAVLAGAAGDPLPGQHGVALYSNITPKTQWFYIIAECDLNSADSDNTIMITPHDREVIVTKNEGS